MTIDELILQLQQICSTHPLRGAAQVFLSCDSEGNSFASAREVGIAEEIDEVEDGVVIWPGDDVVHPF